MTSATVGCPAAWGAERRKVLLSAASRVFPAVELVAEPVAAAMLFAGVAGHAVPEGRCAIVYDFGAGTFDVSVVRYDAGGCTVLASEGRSDCGGLDVDAAIVRRLGETVGQSEPATWGRLTAPSSSADWRASRQLWENARTAKEMLSRSPSALLHVPALDVDVTLGREELEALIAPILASTVEATRAALAAAGVVGPDIGASYLTGGSSRMPAVSTTLHREFGIAPALVEQPELVVAEGGVRADGGMRARGGKRSGGGKAAPATGGAPATRRPHRIAMLAGLMARREVRCAPGRTRSKSPESVCGAAPVGAAPRRRRVGPARRRPGHRGLLRGPFP